MKHCPHCNVDIDAAYEFCPLCHARMGEPSGSLPYPLHPSTPRYRRLLITRKVRAIIVLSIMGIAASVIVNAFMGADVLWCAVVAAGVVYAWLWWLGVVLMPWHFGANVLLQLAGITVVLFVVEAVVGQYVGETQTWAQNFVLPAALIATIVLEIWNLYVSRKRWRECMVYGIVAAILGFAPLILYLAGIITWALLPAVCALVSGVTLAGFIIFSIRQFKNELAKRFHL